MEDLPFTRSDATAVSNPRISVPRSTMCDVVIVKTGRHKYLEALLGDDTLELSEYDPWAVKAAVDGVYHTTPLVRRDLMRLAEAVARADGTLSRVGKNTVFGRLVKNIRQRRGKAWCTPPLQG